MMERLPPVLRSYVVVVVFALLGRGVSAGEAGDKTPETLWLEFLSKPETDDDAGEPLPEGLLAGAAAQSRASRSLLPLFACTETLQRAGKRPVVSDYLLRLDSGPEPTVEELRFRGDRRVAGSKLSVPSAHAWALLFDESSQPYFLYRDLGERSEAGLRVRKILFRGCLPVVEGADIREWEGIATLGGDDEHLLRVEAAPRSWVERMTWSADQWRRSLKMSATLQGEPFLTRHRRKKPTALTVDVRFEGGLADATLPTVMTVTRLQPTEAGVEFASKAVERRRYRDCRFTSTPAVDLDGFREK